MDIFRLSLHLKNRDILYSLVALAKDRDQGEFCLRLAKFFAHEKEDELAVTFFNQALEKGVYDSDSLLVIGKIALEKNLFPEARELFSLALKNFPQDANIYLVYTQTLLKEAFLTLAEGLKKNPDDTTLTNTLKDVQETFTHLAKLKLHL